MKRTTWAGIVLAALTAGSAAAAPAKPGRRRVQSVRSADGKVKVSLVREFVPDARGGPQAGASLMNLMGGPVGLEKAYLEVTRDGTTRYIGEDTGRGLRLLEKLRRKPLETKTVFRYGLNPSLDPPKLSSDGSLIALRTPTDPRREKLLVWDSQTGALLLRQSVNNGKKAGRYAGLDYALHPMGRQIAVLKQTPDQSVSLLERVG